MPPHHGAATGARAPGISDYGRFSFRFLSCRMSSICSLAQPMRAFRWGSSDKPRSVNEYSTLGGYLCIDPTIHNAVLLQGAQRHGQHLLRNIGYGPLEFAESHDGDPLQREYGQDRPLVADACKDVSDGTVPDEKFIFQVLGIHDCRVCEIQSKSNQKSASKQICRDARIKKQRCGQDANHSFTVLVSLW